MSPYLMGSEAEPLTLQQWFGLVLDVGDIHVVRSVTISRASFSSAQENVRRSSARLDIDRSSGLRLSHGAVLGAGPVVRMSNAI